MWADLTLNYEGKGSNIAKNHFLKGMLLNCPHESNLPMPRTRKREEAMREGVCCAYFVLYLKLKAPLHIALSTALISFFFEIHKDFHVGDNEDDVWESH